jgi:segregation and condensation protein B
MPEHITEKSVEELDSEIEQENTKKIEAALFVSGKFLTIQEMITVTDINPILLKKILTDLQDKYEGSGISIVKKENSWKMDVSENYTWMVNRLATGSSEFTSAEQETLAIIAYKQPIKQSVIIKIRGNKAYDHVKKFVQLGLLNKKRTGHTSELTITEQFHEYFHSNRGDGMEDGT